MSGRGATTAAVGVLIVASLTAGLTATTVMLGRPLALDWHNALLPDLTETGLLLLGVSLIALWRGRRGVSLGCATAAILCAALDGALILAAAGLGRDVASAASPAVLAAALGAATIVYQSHASDAVRFGAFATAALGAVTVSGAILLAAAVGGGDLIDGPRQLARLLAMCLLGAVYSTYMAHAALAPPSSALRWLSMPIGSAGIAGTAALAWLLAGNLAGVQAAALVALTATATLAFTATLVATVRLGSATLDLSDSRDKLKRTLGRQRRLMHSRTVALRQSQRRYEDLFKGVPAAVLLTHASGMILTANPAMRDLLGFESDEVLNEVNFGDFYDDPDERARLIREWDASGQNLVNGEVKLRRRDGRDINVLYVTRLVKNAEGAVEYYQGMFTDITALRRAESERRALETHVRLSQKLESVGRLAAGIAHEINTPLQYVGDNIYFLKEAFESLYDLLSREKQTLADRCGERDGQLLQLIRDLEAKVDLDYTVQTVRGALSRTADGINAVNRIVAALTELAHPVQGIKTRTDINALIKTALVLTRNEYRTIAEIETNFEDVPEPLVQKNELCQVLINLIVNAAHAIDAAKRQDRRVGTIRIETRADDNLVSIRVADNGCGIPKAALDKIFDPFFTTKEVGKGTGQGLALARATVVDKHGGYISVDSAPGIGTTFTILLPIEQSSSPRATDSEETG
jgi:PAS domain S-box-containing protein